MEEWGGRRERGEVREEGRRENEERGKGREGEGKGESERKREGEKCDQV